ncbi:hypothetical protein AAA799E16_00550 [Marine Group I thaumarchaeote SCGC AAA799-E16]|uniref:Uncharacterized protein n=2 Tax=Marine Group I TaxID=905826 RepID=A0A087S5L4_9ARCH|nr:hypothetical protein AAA799E16_00550 [Marine Group I thaumarchaeote SCGC AAA799-E16]KFM21018.1 hypothetical protein SCCGRSA3_00025 [Marine Group I thaumarchaeote SCGC RSA3]
MSNNRNNAFIKIEKNAKTIESYRDVPLVFLMKDKLTDEVSYAEAYVGILDCIQGNKIYLNDTYQIEENRESHIYDEFKKWDLTKEDSSVKEFPHIKLEFVDSIFASKLKLTLEQAWNAWSDPRDLLKTQNPKYQKIQETFSKLDKSFSEKSEPIFLNENAEKISLKEIHEMESVDSKPISLIAVTRHQYDISKFSNYENYIKSMETNHRIYYGLWSDGEKTEYDVLYAIPTDNYEDVLNHLNAHDQMNQKTPQSMALVIDSNGKYTVIRNTI